MPKGAEMQKSGVLKMLEEYVYRGSEKLRCGYTTGSCAAAAAKAAAEFILSGSKPSFVNIDTPKGISLELEVQEAEIGEDFAKCGINSLQKAVYHAGCRYVGYLSIFLAVVHFLIRCIYQI